MMPKLLVSVRSALEAEEALAGGADLIDVKEPTAGSLGRAADETVRDIVKRVAGRAPTSAALGELADWDGAAPGGIDFAKSGLAGLGATDWRSRLDAFRRAVERRAVIVAYADREDAGAPLLEDIVGYAEKLDAPMLLIDTHRKIGRTLFDLISEARLAACIARIRRVGGRVALAGSLDVLGIERASSLHPDWIAVRGAVCDGDRTGIVRRDRVRDCKRRIGDC
jgi:(5-formylfuran-3-yl)methyl phosphate synthase